MMVYRISVLTGERNSMDMDLSVNDLHCLANNVEVEAIESRLSVDEQIFLKWGIWTEEAIQKDKRETLAALPNLLIVAIEDDEGHFLIEGVQRLYSLTHHVVVVMPNGEQHQYRGRIDTVSPSNNRPQADLQRIINKERPSC